MTQDPNVERPEDAFDRPHLRVFTLADFATTSTGDSKLYMMGGGVDSINMPVPGPMNPVSLAIRVAMPWNAPIEPFHIVVRLLTPDRNPFGPDPIADITAEMGRPPGIRAGDDIAFQFVVSLAGYPVADAGRYFIHLFLNDELLGVLPFKVNAVQAPAPAPQQRYG